jgi:hypothetical protein
MRPATGIPSLLYGRADKVSQRRTKWFVQFTFKGMSADECGTFNFWRRHRTQALLARLGGRADDITAFRNVPRYRREHDGREKGCSMRGRGGSQTLARAEYHVFVI